MKHWTRKDKVSLNPTELRQLRESGLTLEAIADRLGTTRHVVAKRCCEYGIVYGRGHTPANKTANRCESRREQLNKARKGNGTPLEKREANFIKRLAEDERTAMYEYIGGYKSKREKLTVRCRSCGGPPCRR